MFFGRSGGQSKVFAVLHGLIQSSDFLILVSL